MDFATTMDALSWEFYNRFVKVLIGYGIVYLPLLIFLYQNWLSEEEISRDVNQTIVALTVKRMLISVTIFFFLYYLAFLPKVPLSIVNNFRTADPTPAYDDSTFNQALQSKFYQCTQENKD